MVKLRLLGWLSGMCFCLDFALDFSTPQEISIGQEQATRLLWANQPGRCRGSWRSQESEGLMGCPAGTMSGMQEHASRLQETLAVQKMSSSSAMPRTRCLQLAYAAGPLVHRSGGETEAEQGLCVGSWMSWELSPMLHIKSRQRANGPTALPQSVLALVCPSLGARWRFPIAGLACKLHFLR